jgi:cell division protease FtsH
LGRDIAGGRQYSEEIAAEIDAEVRGLLDDAHAEATGILLTNRFVLDQLAAALIEHETLDSAAVQALLAAAQVIESTIELPSTSSPAGAVAATQHSSNLRRQP